MRLRLPKLTIERGENPATEPGAAPAAAGSVLRGYGPLAAFAVLFVLMAGFVPTVDEEIAASGTAGTDDSGYVDPTQEGGPVVGGPTGDETAGPVGGSTGGGNGPAVVTGGSGGPSEPVSEKQAEALAGRGEGSCAGRDSQIQGDPYSPPCIEFAGGDNGGATADGVTEDTVRISFRTSDEKGFTQTLATLAGADIVDTPSDVRRTVDALVEFFNQHMQFYGRQLEIHYFPASGSVTTELLGGGRAEAQNDARTAKEQINPFIEMNTASEPYSDAIADQGIVGFGSPYLSRDWHNEREPYAWSIATDCSIVSEVAAELAVNTLAGKPPKFAGDNGIDKESPRVLAGLSPENPWYGVCHDAAIKIIEDAGHDSGEKVRYKLDINSMSNQASTVISKLKDVNATTILCGCDPIFPVFLSAKAQEQNYEPEWVVLGTALTDWDISAQLYDQNQWSHAFGVSSLGEPRPIRAGLGYSAYKSVRNDEPAFAVELIYGTLELIAAGVQMAGPNLTPGTFQAGLRAWPGGSGPYGTWGFTERDHTPTRDYRVVYWDTEAISIVNSQPGAYLTAYDGARFAPGNLPTGELQVAPK